MSKYKIIILLFIIYIIWFLEETNYEKENPSLDEDGFIKLYKVKI